MSSCTNTFRNLFPLCTSKVCPTNSGMIVHARAQVLMGCLARFSFSFETFLNNFSFTNGQFLALLLIASPKLAHVYRLRTLLMRAELSAAQDQLVTVLARVAGDAALRGDASL